MNNTMMKELLKLCPFCGGTVEVKKVNLDENSKWMITHDILDTPNHSENECPIATLTLGNVSDALGKTIYESEDEAIACWNQRI